MNVAASANVVRYVGAWPVFLDVEPIYWQLDPAKHQPGLVVHTQGWPLDAKTGGGSFQYHYTNEQGDKLMSIGFVVYLNYENPYLSPFDEFAARQAV